MTDDGRPPADVAAWVEQTAGGSLVGATRHLAGASRQAWSVDVDRDGESLALFLLRDTGRGGGSARDAAVLEALGPTPVPVPAVVGADRTLRTLLLTRVEGSGDFPAAAPPGTREAVAGHLMELTAALHTLPPADLAIEHLGPPAPVPDGGHGAAQLAGVRGVLGYLGDGAHPLFTTAVAWLAEHVPEGDDRTSLVHSDMGPGNFLFADGRVTAVLDWEVAHWGDPMEDLAAIAVRDMATPVGDLRTRFAEYAAAGGPAVDLATVAWYRILVLVRNSMLIGLGLGGDDPAVDRAQLAMYRTMLMRAAALALGDALGLARPDEPAFEGSDVAADDDLALLAHAVRDQRLTVVPALAHDPYAEGRARGVVGVVASIERRLRYAADCDRRDLDDLASVLGHRPTDMVTGLAALRALGADPGARPAVVGVVGRHLVRQASLRAPLLGDLADRVPQPLEEP